VKSTNNVYNSNIEKSSVLQVFACSLISSSLELAGTRFIVMLLKSFVALAALQILGAAFPTPNDEYEYVVVGSGAGGGTVAYVKHPISLLKR
jgi:hypothetical protein